MFQRLFNSIFRGDYEGNTSFPNVFVKRFFNFAGIERESALYIAVKKLYRRTGSRIKIQKSFSFNGEDAILARYLPETKGFYLDIGCGNPIYGSNTYAFYKRGWSGICVDPIPKLIRRHRISRPRDRQILGIVGYGSKTTTLYEYEESDFSTTSVERSVELQNLGMNIRNIRSVRVYQILELDLRALPSDPYLLDLDIEGSELEFLKVIPWEIFSPRVISVEEWDAPIYVKTPVRILLESNGYELVSRAFITSIYVHSEYLNFIEA